MADILNQQVPYSLSAEQSLLGAILINPNVFNEVATYIQAEDFYSEGHKAIYGAIKQMFDMNQKIDVITVVDNLTASGAFDKIGGENYLRTIASSNPVTKNAVDYAKIVKDKSLLRKLILTCEEISGAAYSEQESINDILEHAEQSIYNIAQGKNNTAFQEIKNVLKNVYKNLHDITENKEETKRIDTGFSGIDRVLAGIGKSDFVVLGARPGIGKTSFAMNIATNVARTSGKAVAIFSLEMSCEQLVTRMLSSEAMVTSYALRTGSLNTDDWQRLADAAISLSGCDIQIDDTTGQTVTAMKAKLRRLPNLGFVVIDYLGLMSGDSHTESRVQEISAITRQLKIMAKELNVPVLCCAQLSRDVAKRDNVRRDSRPMLTDLRDSGSIEQDADTVIFLHRPNAVSMRDSAASDDGTAPEDNIVEVIIAKNRHGACANIKMGWEGQFTKFITIEDAPQGANIG